MAFITTSVFAFEIAETFEAIRKQGGHAAIDYKDGQITLVCTKPNNAQRENKKAWGRGALPQAFPGWVRLAKC